MVLLSARCMQLCSQPSNYINHQKHDTALILLLSSVAVGSIFVTENLINVSLTVISLAVCYSLIIKTRSKSKQFDHTKYNSKSRHPSFQLIDELGWDKYYKNLISTINDTEGFAFKGDRIYATDYQIFNYYVTTLPKWNEYHILCRGLIIDPKQKKLIATPFPKFFNYGEFQNEVRKRLQNEFISQKDTVQINEKMDGSLGIIFYCDTVKHWRCATRGSFASNQAQWATEYLRTNATVYQNIFVRGHTYLAEIIWSENKIIIEYDYECLVLLAAYNEKGYEYKYEYLKSMTERMAPTFRISKRFRFDSVKDLMRATETLDCQKEGWVVTYESGMRIKFKGKDYLGLVKISKDINEKTVERVIIEQGLSEKALLATVPEEFHGIISEWYAKIYGKIRAKCRDIAMDVINTNGMSNRDLGKWLHLKAECKSEEELEDSQMNNIVLKSELSKKGMIFGARKLLNESLWKCDVNECDMDAKVDAIVVEMMKAKEWKRKLMRK